MTGRLLALFVLGGATILPAQAIPTASRKGDFQVGIGFTAGTPDYVQQTFPGFAAYADFDFRPHIGIEGEFHQIYSTNGDLSLERTYDLGGRYFRNFGPLSPYAKAMYGRGDFRYPYGYTQLGYNLFAFAGGADLKVGPYLRVRGEYELQKWMSFPNGGFHPQLVTIGVAYHFAGKSGFR